MEIKAFPCGMLGTNCYIVYDKNNCVIFDPDFAFPSEYEMIREFLKDKKLHAVVLTHGHFDHIGSVDEVCSEYGVPLYIHEQDKEMLTDTRKNASFLLPDLSVRCKTDANTFNNEDVLRFGSVDFKVMHTPGHTKGSCCFIFEDFIISGDTLFKNGLGRTDLYGGSSEELYSSLRKLFSLEKNYKVYPGHDGSTTLDKERS